MTVQRSPVFSMVVTSYGTERLSDVFALLESVANQTLTDMETIFVVERSKSLQDKINEFVGENRIPNVTIVFSNEHLGLSAARNLGIDHASGDIIAFVDDDVVLYPDWAERTVESLQDDSVIGVTGSAFPLWEDESLKWLPEEYYWLTSCTGWTGLKEDRKVRGALGANMAFKKEAFSDGCLFSTGTGYSRGSRHQPLSDDLEFSLRIRRRTGKSILFTPGMRVWHRVSKRRLGVRFVTARSHQVGCTRRIVRRYFPEEYGRFEQETRVLKGTLRILSELPKEFFSTPFVACKKLCLIVEVFVSAGAGYLIPLPRYSPLSTEPQGEIPASRAAGENGKAE